MKIERVLIRDLRALRSRDDVLSGADGPWDSLCLRGLNDSGKTTWLEAVAQVWQWFRRCTTRMRYTEQGLPLTGDPNGRRWEPGLLEWWAEAFERALVGGSPVPNNTIGVRVGEEDTAELRFYDVDLGTIRLAT